MATTEKPVPPEITPEAQAMRRLFGFLLFPLTLLPLLSLLTYDWRDIAWLCSPPNTPPVNAIGQVGAWMVFFGYHIFGLAFWLVPLWTLLYSGMLLYGKALRMNRRLGWIALFMLALCSLLQLQRETFAPLLTHLNLRPNAGGAIGYLLMTRLCENWINPVGSAILMTTCMAVSLIMLVGVRNIIRGMVALGVWIAARREARETQADENNETPATSEISPREAAAKAREAARLASQAEKERERDEKRKAKEAAQQAKTAEEAERRRLHEEQRAAATEPDPRTQHLDRQESLRRQMALARDAAAAQAKAEREAAAIPPVAFPPPAAMPRRMPAAEPQTATPVPTAATPAAPAAATAAPVRLDLPSIDLLNPNPGGLADSGDIEHAKHVIVTTLKQFKIDVEVTHVETGPVITQFELLPAPGVKVESIASLVGNLKLVLKAASMRVQAPIPGKGVVGLEVPNRTARMVTLREVLEGPLWKPDAMAIPLALGKDAGGIDLVVDLAEMPHLLVAGATGAGKSVGLNAILAGLLMSRTPEDLRLILVDPKQVEFMPYNNLPHLLVPVITDAKKVSFGLRWAISEMEKRYKLLQSAHVRNIAMFNDRRTVKQDDLFAGQPEAAADDGLPAKLPYIVIVIDEVADLMATVGKEIESGIARLTAKSRAVGIHLILATQRPTVDVITGTIKANIPGRIAFKVAQKNDSRTILDAQGAENLIGKGDMLFLNPKTNRLVRSQGAWVCDAEIERLVAVIKQQSGPAFDTAFIARMEKIREVNPEDDLDDAVEAATPSAARGAAPAEGTEVPEDGDEILYRQALEVVRETRRGSVSMIQRRLRIGYTRAARLADLMEARGILGPARGSEPREILVDLDNQIPDNSIASPETGEPGDETPPREEI